jgi:hypothetical protein
MSQPICCPFCKSTNIVCAGYLGVLSYHFIKFRCDDAHIFFVENK